MNLETDLDRFGSRRSVVYGASGVVATSQPLAAQAGIDRLQAGGNAFDAAVASAAALNVVEPTSTGLGGDVFALYRTADGAVGGMRSCGWAPEGATIEAVRRAVAEEDGIEEDEVEMPTLGPHTVTIPGTARGWEATVERFGRQTLADALGPAIRYATEGYPVSEMIASHWAGAEELFTHEHAREAYLIDGRSPREGERIRLERLGESMRRIAEAGADIVYEGEIAEAIASEVQARGGFMTVEDLAGFEPSFPEPIETTYRGATVYELPPNNQGLIALEALNIAEAVDAGDQPYGSPDRIHRFAEAMKRAFHDGHHYITDPAFEDVPPLGSKEYAADRAASIDPGAASDVGIGVPGTNAEEADTVLTTVADEAGNLVSLINSRFMGFGSGLVAGETGIALQNRGSSFSLDPEHPNRLEPGKRPFHTLMPGLARFDADDWAAFGVVGGYMQPQGHVQVLSNLLDYGKGLQEALDAPRWRYREDGSLAVEARTPPEVSTKLAKMGHDVGIDPNYLFGGAQIVRNDGGVLSGATEPRADGTVAGF